jgi:mannose-1-phosphate guanylyltransferase
VQPRSYNETHESRDREGCEVRYAVVMAGGAGTRLWPAATREMPKQFQRLIFEAPLIVETVDRLARVYDRANILIVTAERYAAAMREVLPDLPAENIIVEPFGRNTAAAIALAAFRIARDDPDGVFGVFPADHVMLKPEALFSALAYAHDLAHEHRVVDIGVPPSHPETGYGYIELGEPIESRGEQTVYRVKRFVEKPDLQRATEYLAAGTYIWNSGMFVWRADRYLSALQTHLPNTYARLCEAVVSGDPAQLAAAYEEIESISVDYAIMERETDVVALSVDFGWRDVGDWAALYDLLPKDADGNAIQGRHLSIDSTGCLVLSQDKAIATIGMHDLVVVETDNVILILPRERAQDVKALQTYLEERGLHDLL